MAEIMVDLSSDDQTISVPLATVFGTGIARIEQTVTSEDPEIPNEITCTLTNGQQSKFYIKNGKDGYSPSITIEQGAEGYSITVTDEEGSHEYSIIVDSTLDAESANPIQNQAVAGAVTQLTSDIALINRKGGLTEDIKQALLNCFKFVAFINDQGQSYVDALEEALYPPVNLVSITAVFNQADNIIYDTDSLDDLKQYLTVTANLNDGTHKTVTSYTLSGTLTVGTSVITVSYSDKTTTFSVVVERSSDTTAILAYENYAIEKGGILASKTNAAVTFKYSLNNPSTVLHPAGVIVNDGTLASNSGVLAIYKDDYYVNYVDESSRWAKAPSTSYTEYNTQKWNVAEYNQIAFTVDVRYLDDSYMYDYETGQVFFAGKNTPYYKMANIDGTPSTPIVIPTYTTPHPFINSKIKFTSNQGTQEITNGNHSITHKTVGTTGGVYQELSMIERSSGVMAELMTPSNIQNRSTIYTLPVGEVTLKVKNVEFTQGGTTAPTHLNVYVNKSGTSNSVIDIQDIALDETEISETVTLSEATDVNLVWFYAGMYNAGDVLEFDVEIYVNGERWT